jgi:hypothetical protein
MSSSRTRKPKTRAKGGNKRTLSSAPRPDNDLRALNAFHLAMMDLGYDAAPKLRDIICEIQDGIPHCEIEGDLSVGRRVTAFEQNRGRMDRLGPFGRSQTRGLSADA